MQDDIPGFEVAFLLIGAFRQMIDDLHVELAAQGFPEVRPSHGFALQALGSDELSISELSRRLGVSKQAVSKTVKQLEEIGCVIRTADPSDARASLVARSDRGRDLLRRSETILDQRRDRWRREIGDHAFTEAVSALRQMGSRASLTDLEGWLQKG